ncbi:MAG: terminase small subunit [Candidatus Sulfotelmatobacter sp.]
MVAKGRPARPQACTACSRTPSHERRKLFVAEYLTDLNATRAAIAAGYSSKTAGQQGSRLLKNVKVVAEIAAKTKARTSRLEIRADNVLQELAKLAFFDPRKLFNPDGTAKQITELDDDTAAGVAGLDVHEIMRDGAGGCTRILIKKYKLVDKGQNVERLGKHLGLF